jgi:prepilin peptidase CpaA
MIEHSQLSNWILGTTSVVLFWMALTDFREFKIRNEMVLAVAGLYVLYAIVSGRWVAMPWNVGFALLMGAVMLYSYSRQHMGGGDVKLLTVAYLWTGPFCAASFAILLLLFMGMHYAAARFGWVAMKPSPQGGRIPLAPSIAAALIGTFALGCIASPRW